MIHEDSRPSASASDLACDASFDAAMDVQSLFQRIYPDARSIAHANLRHERPDHTLQPTALVHEAYLRLVASRQSWSSAGELLAAATRTIRRVLVDHARARKAQRRGQGRRPLDFWKLQPVVEPWSDDVIDLDQSLSQLQTIHPRRAQIAQLKLFAGLSNEQIAAALDIARSTVADDWSVARAWLSRALSEEPRNAQTRWPERRRSLPQGQGPA